MKNELHENDLDVSNEAEGLNHLTFFKTITICRFIQLKERKRESLVYLAVVVNKENTIYR